MTRCTDAPTHCACSGLQCIQCTTATGAIQCGTSRYEDKAVAVSGRLKNTAIPQVAGPGDPKRPCELDAVASLLQSEGIDRAVLVPSYHIFLPAINVIYRGLAKIAIAVVVVNGSVLPACGSGIPIHAEEGVLLVVAVTSGARVASSGDHLVCAGIGNERRPDAATQGSSLYHIVRPGHFASRGIERKNSSAHTRVVIVGR